MEVLGRAHDDSEHYYDRLDVDAWVADLLERTSRGDTAAISEALEFLAHGSTVVTLPSSGGPCG